MLQVGFQLPAVARHLKGLRLSVSVKVAGVRDALRSFAPLVAARGAVQLSGYLDLVLASLLAVGAVGALGWAQTLYLMPISLFGLSVAAAELPELSRKADRAAGGEIADRFQRAARQMTFLTVPTSVGYLAFGFLIVGAIYRRGSFGLVDNWLVYLILASYTLGLVASTSSRLLSNVFYSLRETRVPARIAVWRVMVSALVGACSCSNWIGSQSPIWLVGMASAVRHCASEGSGLALGAAAASWLELSLLWRQARRRVPGMRFPVSAVRRQLILALTAAIPAFLVSWVLQDANVLLEALLVVGCFAGVYLVSCYRLGMPEIKFWMKSLGRKRSSKR